MSISHVMGNRVSNACLFAACLLLSTTTQSCADPFSDCTNRTDLDLKIKGCSQLIEQPSTGKKQLYLAYNLRGSAYAQRTEYDRAIADLTKGTELDPSDAIVFAARGEAFRRKGEVDKAIGDFNRAIGLDAHQASAYHSRGLAYLTKKDYNRAIADLSTAIEINPRSAMAFHDRALIHEALRQREKAIDDFRAALQLDPRHRSSQDGLKRIGAAVSSTATGSELCGRHRA